MFSLSWHTWHYFGRRQNQLLGSCQLQSIMWVLIQTRKRQRACENFLQRLFFRPVPQKASSRPLLRSVIAPHALQPSLPPVTPPPLFFSPQKNARHSVNFPSASMLLNLCLLPSPAVSHIFCVLWSLPPLFFLSSSQPVRFNPGLESVFNQAALMYAVNPSPPPLQIVGYIPHQGQGVH